MLPLDGPVTADVVVIGGGYTGMWAAWELLERGATVVLLESAICGHGPSGRNGGFCESMWLSAAALRERRRRARPSCWTPPATPSPSGRLVRR